MATAKKETKEVTTTNNKKGEKKMLVELVNGKKVYASVVFKNTELMKKFTSENLEENCNNIIFNGATSKPKFRKELPDAVKATFDKWCEAHPAAPKKEKTGTRRTAFDIIQAKFSKAIEALSEVEKAELNGSFSTVLASASAKLAAVKKAKKNNFVAKVKKMTPEQIAALKKAIEEAEAVEAEANN